MSISIGTSTPSSIRDTHAAWLRRREDSRPYLREWMAGAGEQARQGGAAERES